MGTCVWCGKSGFFLSVNKHGLCRSCESVIAVEAHSRMRVINESVEILKKTKSLGTALSRIDIMVEHARELKKFHDKCPNLITPSPDEIIQICKRSRNEFIEKFTLEEIEKHKIKAELVASPTSKITELTKALIKIKDAQDKCEGVSQALSNKEKSIQSIIHKYKLEGFLEAAKKAEFKKQYKKALDQYQEALYFLKNDDVPDIKQSEQITLLENKIKELESVI